MSRAMSIIAGVILLFVLAPLLIIVPMSFSTAPSLQFPPPGYGLTYYREFVTDTRWTGALVNSIIIATLTSIVTMAVAVPASFAIVRHRFRSRGLMTILLLLPLIAPHIVLALGYYVYFGSLRLTQTYTGVVLAHSCISIPVVYLTVSAALKGFDRSIERAAMNLGAGPLRVFRHVTLPVLRPAFVAAALFAFVQSFDETVIAIFISGRDAATLPRQMFDSMRTQADPVVAVVSTLLLAIVVAGVAGSRIVAARRAAFARRSVPVAA